MATYNPSRKSFQLSTTEGNFTAPEILPDGTPTRDLLYLIIEDNALSNFITGHSGSDWFFTSGGADTFAGGAGSDIYELGKRIEVAIIENANEGHDQVRVSLSYVLPSNVEDLQINGAGDLAGTGNTLNNLIFSTGGGNDTLDGGAGADELYGFAGNDTYVVDDAQDKVAELANEGIDTVRTSVDFLLGANFEHLVLTGSSNLKGTGNDLANRITGNDASNILDSGAGADALYGGIGRDILKGGIDDDKLSGGRDNDKLTGDSGLDIFIFDAKLGSPKTDRTKNFDTITDFSVQDDAVWLSSKVFKVKNSKQLGAGASEFSPKQLKKAFFKIGSKAEDANDYFIYNKKTGVLSFDADGSGSKEAVEFANIGKKLKLTNKDFFMI